MWDNTGMNNVSTPVCPIAATCGGCSCINVPYAQQLANKQQRITTLFAPLLTAQGSQPSDVVLPILGMETPQHYRNKIVSPFAPSHAKRSVRSMARTGRAGRVALRKGDILTGLYAAGTHKVIACESCPVEHPVGRQVVAAVRDIMARYGVVPYDEDAGTGFMRHVVVRVGAHSGEVLVTLVTNGREFVGSKNFCRELVKRVPEITTIVQNINTRQTNVIFGEESQVLYGPGFILDTLCGLSFRISSGSFYQVNAMQTEVLYRRAIELMAGQGSQENRPSDTPAPTILDAYCGTGTIGLVAAKAIPQATVVGVDSAESSIADARQNAAHNGIDNAIFIAQDAGTFMRDYAAAGRTVDGVFLDPPRTGASEDFLKALSALAPERVVYISCNPETQVRDCQLLLESGYRLSVVAPVDMFPHTNHVETVVQLSKGNISSQNVRVELSLEDMDMSRFQQGATYEQIQNFGCRKSTGSM